jgi:hypothetical protein
MLRTVGQMLAQRPAKREFSWKLAIGSAPSR